MQPGLLDQGRGACPDAPLERPAVRFAAENPSAVFGSQEPSQRKEERGKREEGEKENKSCRIAFFFFFFFLVGLDLFQVALRSPPQV